MKRILLIFLSFIVLASSAICEANEEGISPVEQEILYLINLARSKPFLMAEFLGMDVERLREIAGVWFPVFERGIPPVVPNNVLREAALGHSDDMLTRLYYEYNTPEGITPFDRIVERGYSPSFVAEHIGLLVLEKFLPGHDMAQSLFQNLFIDELTPGRYIGPVIFNPQAKEIGIGLIGAQLNLPGFGEKQVYVITCDFAADLQDRRPAITGVVYEDCNGDGLYTAGEGLGGVTIQVKGAEKLYETTTWGAGGYVLRPDSGGLYELTATGGELGDRVERRLVPLGKDNVEVDISLPCLQQKP
ncbi:Proline-rich protein [Dissulfuribacter thermophilus]|uniref:Proline-rich protein n=1 Tax=Dissulfuribacter thermophilus TaxID=1156395 RepID=A0A1B9F354_9BACT|nr:hypothetical protein [Dissulfuribacter thermophilus]OCC14264.1 Proline-rich protein [Dissulfuribacter thermophilus]